MKKGKKIIFKEGEVAEILFSNGCEWKENAKGEMNIRKVDANWAEGKFSFTAKGFQTDKTKEAMDGFFRISLSEKK